MKLKSFLTILLSTFIGIIIMNGQNEYLEITKSPRKIYSLGGGQQFTEKWPIPELGERFQTIVLNATILTDIDMDAFIEDMNKNPRITMLKIGSSLKKNYNPEAIQNIPFGELKYVQHLAFAFDRYDAIPLNKIINWNDVIEMKSLEYLYPQPFSEYGSRGEKIVLPDTIKNILAKNLKGYFNYGYAGEFDDIQNNFETLGLIVKEHQENQDLDILSQVENLNYGRLNNINNSQFFDSNTTFGIGVVARKKLNSKVYLSSSIAFQKVGWYSFDFETESKLELYWKGLKNNIVLVGLHNTNRHRYKNHHRSIHARAKIGHVNYII